MGKIKSKQKISFEKIKNFWDSEAMQKGQAPSVTIRDHFFRIHELNILMSLVLHNNSILDVGCGTGFGTLILNAKASRTVGIDYSAPMISWAKKLLKDDKYRKKLFLDLGYLYKKPETKHIKFYTQDVLKPFKFKIKKQFDVIMGQRVLINMINYKNQVKLLKNLKKYSSPDTLFLFTEATLQGHERTNKLRKKFNVPKLEKYWRNFYVDEKKLDSWKKIGLKIKFILSFDTYMLLSKVIYPAAYGPKNCEFISGANLAAMEVANIFRTKKAVDEIGLENMINFYLRKVKKYNIREYEAIKKWTTYNLRTIKKSNWNNLGHQKLFIFTLA